MHTREGAGRALEVPLYGDYGVNSPVPHRTSRWPRTHGGGEIPPGRYICSKSPLLHAQYQIVPRLVRSLVLFPRFDRRAQS